VLLIGAGVSSTDIAKELGPIAQRIYQSSRSGDFDLPAHLLPENASRVGPVTAFDFPNNQRGHGDLRDEEPLPLKATIASGEQLCDIDYVILCTGYMFSLPFLKEFHNDQLAPEEADDKVLVTDGRQIHNLYKDIFYIPDPSLIFIGVPFYTATFSLFDFQALIVSAVLSGRAKLPSEHEMRAQYDARVSVKGYGRHFHSLREREEEYVNELLTWVNRDITALGQEPIQGHSLEWLLAKAEARKRMQLLFAMEIPEQNRKVPVVLPLCS
jgi:ACS family pantothenate transporter-like MFS transporter